MLEIVLKSVAAVAILGFIFALLPTTPALPTAATDAITWIVTQSNSWGTVLPVTQAYTVLSLILATEAIIFSFHAATWIFNKFFGSK